MKLLYHEAQALWDRILVLERRKAWPPGLSLQEQAELTAAWTTYKARWLVFYPDCGCHNGPVAHIGRSCLVCNPHSALASLRQVRHDPNTAF